MDIYIYIYIHIYNYIYKYVVPLPYNICYLQQKREDRSYVDGIIPQLITGVPLQCVAISCSSKDFRNKVIEIQIQVRSK